MRRGEIVAHLGEPEAVSVRPRKKSSRPIILKYFDLELWLSPSEAETCIGLYLEPETGCSPVLPAALAGSAWELPAGASREEVIAYLREQGLNFRDAELAGTTGGTLVVGDRGVCVAFDDKGKLMSFYVPLEPVQ